MNFLFWTILIALAIAGAAQWWLGRSRSEPQNSSQVLRFTQDENWPLKEGTWSIDEVDFLGAAGRIRAVVTLKIDDGDEKRRRKAMEFLAHEIYRHVEAEAVFVEALGHPDGPESYLFAADGRGWWGSEIISTVFSDPGVSTRQQR